jgi:hypothetical protein
MRPLGIVVLVVSSIALVELLGLSIGSVQADAVASARVIDHPSPVGSFITSVFVNPGDPVEVGTPPVELSPHFPNQNLVELSLEIEQSINEGRLAQAKLLVSEERWLRPGLRHVPKRPSLEGPTEAYYAKRLEVLNAQREVLLENRSALTIRSNFQGIVDDVTWLGASIAPG